MKKKGEEFNQVEEKEVNTEEVRKGQNISKDH